MIRVAVVGCGYWGPNLMRNLMACPLTELAVVCDQAPDRLSDALAPYPGVRACTSYGELLSDRDIEAVVLATPVATHAPLALAALAAGKHVLVEKPLAASTAEAQSLARAAQRAGRVLMVDHTFVYSGPVRKMKQLVDAGELGQLYFIDSVRINLGLFRHDVNVVWDLAVHDVSILEFLLGRLPESVGAFGGCHADTRGQVEDLAYLTLDYGHGLLASLHVNWLSPVKIRHLLVGGSRKSMVYNDLDPSEKLKVYDRGLVVGESVEARRALLVDYRAGDVWSPHVEAFEPLARVVREFAECITQGRAPLTDAQSGSRVVQVLEAAQQSLRQGGARVPLAR